MKLSKVIKRLEKLKKITRNLELAGPVVLKIEQADCDWLESTEGEALQEILPKELVLESPDGKQTRRTVY